jgi:hypothetical protein
MPGIDLKASPVAELLKLIGATAVFGIGLYQYAQAQKWKRKRRESIVLQFREFEADKSIQLVMTMLDWTDRPLHFRSDIGGSPIAVRVDGQLLSSALLPHEAARCGRKRTEFHFKCILDWVRETEMEFRAH